MEFMQCNQTYTNISRFCQLWPGSKWLQPVTKEQINTSHLCSSALLHLNYCNRLLSQPPASTLLLFQPVSSPKLSENIAPRMILLKCKSEHNTFPFKSPQCHFIVWDYLAFVWAALALSKYVLAIASSQSRFFPWAAPSPRNFTLVSLCAHGAIREVVFHTTSPEDFIYTDLPLHSGSEYPDRLLHSNCLSLQNLFINSCLCYFLISSLKDWKRLCLSYSLL